MSFEKQIMSKDKYLSIFLKSNGGYCGCPSNIFRLRTVNCQKRLERMLFSDTALSTRRFISPSVTKANRSPILTLILIAILTRLEVFQIGEYHLGNLDQSHASENI